MSQADGFSQDLLEEIREIFDHFDRDSNGVIDASEFRALLEALGADMEPEEIALGLSIVDADSNGTVEWDEFLPWWAENRPA